LQKETGYLQVEGLMVVVDRFNKLFIHHLGDGQPPWGETKFGVGVKIPLPPPQI
jgi:hypothetical protein